jgi:hypothetical protein
MITPNAFAESVSNNIGSMSIDESKYEISSNPDELIRIYGIIQSPMNTGKGNIQIQQPDGTLKGGLFEIKNDGSFEYFFKLNNKSQVGDYVIFGTYSSGIIGKLTFSILPMSMESIKEIRERDGVESSKILAEEKAKLLAEEKAMAKAVAEEKAKLLAEEKAMDEQNKISAVNTFAKIVLLLIGILIVAVIIKGKKMNQKHPDENYIVDRVKRNPYD